MNIQKHYNRLAAAYDPLFNLINKLYSFDEMQYRKQAIDKLNLGKGDTIVEIGCGTGRNFSLLEKLIGKEGKIIGIDTSLKMLKKAYDKILLNQWSNVELYNIDIKEIGRIKDVCGHNPKILSILVYCTLWHDTMLRENFISTLRDSERFSVMDANPRLPSSKFMKYILKATSSIFAMPSHYWDNDGVYEFERIEGCKIEEIFHKMLFIAHK